MTLWILPEYFYQFLLSKVQYIGLKSRDQCQCTVISHLGIEKTKLLTLWASYVDIDVITSVKMAVTWLLRRELNGVRIIGYACCTRNWPKRVSGLVMGLSAMCFGVIVRMFTESVWLSRQIRIKMLNNLVKDV